MANIKINSQYLKDLSFEIPVAPQVFLTKINKPNININIDIDAKKISDNGYEVTLKVGAKATAEEKIVFLCESSYAGIFTLDSKLEDDQEIEQILLIYCPNILFPFARQIISDVVGNGGFPPLMLEPINFAELYKKRREKIESQNNKDSN